MNAHLFQAHVKDAWDRRNDRPGTKQYVVAEAASRSKAAERAMRKIYALEANARNLGSVELVWLGTVEVAR